MNWIKVSVLNLVPGDKAIKSTEGLPIITYMQTLIHNTLTNFYLLSAGNSHQRHNNIESEWDSEAKQAPVEGTVCARDGARINVELILVLKRIKPMCVSGDENVDVKLSLDHRQTLGVTPWHHLMSMTKTYTKVSDCHHLLLRIVQILYSTHNYIQLTLDVNDFCHTQLC